MHIWAGLFESLTLAICTFTLIKLTFHVIGVFPVCVNRHHIYIVACDLISMNTWSLDVAESYHLQLANRTACEPHMCKHMHG